MIAVMIILCAVSITYSIFLIARFGIKRKEGEEYVSADKNFDQAPDNKK